MKRLKDNVIKPWGKYMNMAEEKDRWHLKVILLKKGKRLSLQRHQLRSEMWIVAQGKIKAEIGKEILTLSASKTAFIKYKEIHRMTAIEDSTVIEVTYGTHKEKDIERLEDDFGREN